MLKGGKKDKTRYIVITGGVLSGLGKGVVTGSIGNILKSQGYSVSAIKIDPYINIDAGTMRPTEHGEVWVTYDGGETDMDLGNYERFMDVEVPKSHSITTGQVYLSVIQKERNLEYDGKCVEVTPHIPLEVRQRIKKVAKNEKSNFVLVEIGGTVGDYQSVLFLDAVRQMKLEGEDVTFVHVVYLPIPKNLGEMKSKPAQHSVRELNSIGIQPDFIVARASRPVDDIRRAKLSLFCNVPKEHIVSSPDIKNIYEVPCLFEENGFAKTLCKKLGFNYKQSISSKRWKKFMKGVRNSETEVSIGIIGKYFDIGDFALEDSYVSVIESVKHACWHNKVKPKISWIDSKDFEKNPKKVVELNRFDAIIVPGGFGSSGVEGKIEAIRFARENNIPYLGLCYGMQLAVIEFARNVCNMKGANSSEINPKTKYKVVDILDEQIEKMKKKDYGGSMRLGNYPAQLVKGTLVHKLYGKDKVVERHRHRYEINPKYINQIEKKGMVFSGKSPNRMLMEFMELKDHPYFVGTQAHPEFKSRPMRPAPLFDGLINAAKKAVQKHLLIKAKH